MKLRPLSATVAVTLFTLFVTEIAEARGGRGVRLSRNGNGPTPLRSSARGIFSEPRGTPYRHVYGLESDSFDGVILNPDGSVARGPRRQTRTTVVVRRS